jgi:hypothetical protein
MTNPRRRKSEAPTPLQPNGQPKLLIATSTAMLKLLGQAKAILRIKWRY